MLLPSTILWISVTFERIRCAVSYQIGGCISDMLQSVLSPYSSTLRSLRLLGKVIIQRRAIERRFPLESQRVKTGFHQCCWKMVVTLIFPGLRGMSWSSLERSMSIAELAPSPQGREFDKKRLKFLMLWWSNEIFFALLACSSSEDYTQNF